MAFLRLMILMLIPLAVIYASLLAFLCARHGERLSEEYQPGASARERQAFVKAGVRAYAMRIRGRLAAAVFGVPLAGLAVHIYMTNTM
ncbi:hypothetical protein DKT77_03980 [Meridianimarinicoccus roseus]|jgi:hypothetical protein|uniref:Uncharacterized protein n=1 Tax=Meridianimarinicoccus roseus TaxID=2072018 RepID=A0A2V2LE98_9RHOB|nr:hypothetical protein [Meridianimarinicoccus roseus]PWR03880.1 hypothetical protein DKT77_03980 [Meridianimarinicoccus roseus]